MFISFWRSFPRSHLQCWCQFHLVVTVPLYATELFSSCSCCCHLHWLDSSLHSIQCCMLLLAHNEIEPNYGTHEHHTTIIQAKLFWKNLASIADWTVSKKSRKWQEGGWWWSQEISRRSMHMRFLSLQGLVTRQHHFCVKCTLFKFNSHFHVMNSIHQCQCNVPDSVCT